MAFVTEFGSSKPIRGELVCAVSHILPAKHTKFEHLFRRKLGLELRVKILTCRLGAEVNVALLHQIINRDALFSHRG